MHWESTLCLDQPVSRVFDDAAGNPTYLEWRVD
jgi:hypothetical protein